MALAGFSPLLFGNILRSDAILSLNIRALKDRPNVREKSKVLPTGGTKGLLSKTALPVLLGINELARRLSSLRLVGR